ncbi:MAG: hypothetical protein AAGG51_11860 [Cyanobacteria bacterium P01_G01_bin.54]
MVVASYSLRLSNHFILVGFCLALLCIGKLWVPEPQLSDFLVLGVRGLLAMMYFFAFLHKCNWEYVSPERSCAAQLVEFQCRDRGITNQQFIQISKRIAIYGTLFVEALLAVLLVVSYGTLLIVTITLGICFHFVLALAGILNFSSVMYAGLIFLIPYSEIVRASNLIKENSIVVTCIMCICILLVWAVTPRHAGVQCPYILRWPAWIIQVGFGVFTALVLTGLLFLLQQKPLLFNPALNTIGSQYFLIIQLFWLLFLINGLSPYLGIKVEFSFAMFSNLRHEPWNHIFIPKSWRLLDLADYVSLSTIEGIPAQQEVVKSPIAKLVRNVICNSEEYMISRRFLYEGLREISMVVPSRKICVTYARNMQTHSIECYKGSLSSSEPSPIPLSLFPFVMPLDLNRPHSEQGSLLSEKESRRLF